MTRTERWVRVGQSAVSQRLSGSAASLALLLSLLSSHTRARIHRATRRSHLNEWQCSSGVGRRLSVVVAVVRRWTRRTGTSQPPFESRRQLSVSGWCPGVPAGCSDRLLIQLRTQFICHRDRIALLFGALVATTVNGAEPAETEPRETRACTSDKNAAVVRPM